MKKAFPLVLSIVALSSLYANDKFANKDTSISVPVTDQEKREIKVAKKIKFNTIPSQTKKLEYKTLLKTGDELNGEIFGLLKDENDKPIREEDGSLYICNGQFGGSGPDHTQFIEKNGKIYMITQFECQIGAIYKSELEQDPKTGELTPKNLEYISQKDYHGGWVHCAGSKTPWNSFLGSEEYEPNAKKLDPKTGKLDAYYNLKAPYFGGDLQKSSPYYYGWITEIKLDDNGNASYTKHYSMGRFSHELAYVMPDQRTVYLSDDGTNTALFMYIADKPADLSSGTLYAAKWIQISSKGAGKAKLKWIKLAHGRDFEIKRMVDSRLKFNDIFDEAKPKNGTCPIGYTSINTSAGHECLKIKPGMEKAAAFLESRRYAAIKGATTEFRKMEGITYDPDKERLYISMSSIGKGMEDNKKKGKPNNKYDIGGNNDIRLKYNPCGAVYALDIRKSDESNFVAKNMYSIIEGKPKKYPKNSKYATNKCDINSIANPDNITYLPGKYVLLIGEDTSKHQNDYLWAFNTRKNKLQDRVVTTPYGSETTSVYWQPNLNGFSYINFVTQHPYGETDQDKKRNPEDVQSIIGYIQVK